ncbi:MAG: pyrroline-5-carboxylate reductase [Limnochordia bacterium]|jgi:pyrroline-5-carboxylate reductase
MAVKLAVIGGGAMGSALIEGVLKAGLYEPREIIVTDLNGALAQGLGDRLGISVAEDNQGAVVGAETILLAVKPQGIPKVLGEIRGKVKPQQLIISIAAGVQIKTMEALLPHNPIIRVMPNTPCLIGQGACGLSPGSQVGEGELEVAVAIFSAVGQTVVVAEELLDAVTGLSGSGPAYVLTILEALSDGGVAAGLPRETAWKLALQTVLGTAQLAAQLGRHPAQLREMVTSPGGTTITGLRVLEREAVRSAFIEAVVAATEKSRALGE